MDQKHLFEIGARLVGLYFLAGTLPYLVGSITQAVVLFETTGHLFAREKLYDTLSFVSDILLVVIGVCLLKGHYFVRRILFQEQESAPASRMKEFFTVGVKLVGILLAVGTIPRLTRSLSYFFFIVTADTYSSAAQIMGGRSYFVPELASILFGMLLCVRGELLSAWAFPSADDGQSTAL
jgi:hypothetical protein